MARANGPRRLGVPAGLSVPHRRSGALLLTHSHSLELEEEVLAELSHIPSRFWP